MGTIIYYFILKKLKSVENLCALLNCFALSERDSLLLLTFVRLWVIFWDYGGTVGVSRLEKKKNLILSVCKFSKFHLFFSIFWFPGQFFTKNKMHIYPHFQNSSYLWSEEAGHCQTNKKLSWFNFFLDRTHVWI